MAEKEYIERGAAINRLLSVAVTGDVFGMGVQFGVDHAIAVLNEAPAADVGEAKHGKWIDKPTGSYGRMQSWCSACGKHSGIGGIESNRHNPYCPNCGARMDGADHD